MLFFLKNSPDFALEKTLQGLNAGFEKVKSDCSGQDLWVIF